MLRLTLFSTFFLIAYSSSTFAADNHGPLAPRIASRQSNAANIRVTVKLVLVPVSVFDNNGRSITGLDRDNFRVVDGSRQVPITAFSRQDQPVTVGLIFDCSGSMGEKFRTARDAPAQLYQQLNLDDESFLVTIADNAALREPLTSDFAKITNSLLFARPKGTTALVDGIYMGLQYIRRSHNPRRALVIVSDGGENNSRYSLRELESMAVESDTQIFAIGLYDNPQSTEEADGPGLVTELCRKTGGVNFMLHDRAGSKDALAKIGTALHNQYVLGYYPPQATDSGKYRKIKVQLVVPQKLPLTVRARAGYYVPEQ